MRVWRSSCWVLARAGGRRQTVRSGWHCSSPQLERYVQRCDPLRKKIRSTSCGTDTGGPTSKSSICVRMPSPTSLRVSDTSCLASRTISDLNASNEPDCASPTTAYYAVAHRTLLWISVTCCIMHDVCTCFATCCGLCYIGLCYARCSMLQIAPALRQLADFVAKRTQLCVGELGALALFLGLTRTLVAGVPTDLLLGGSSVDRLEACRQSEKPLDKVCDTWYYSVLKQVLLATG